MTGRARDAELFAAYALDAVDEDDALLVETTLATSARAAVEVGVMRDVAADYGLATIVPVDPGEALRERVLRAGLSSRPGSPATPADARAARRIELERFLALVEHLTPHDWDRAVDPPEFAGWTVRDVVSHVTSTETLTAQVLDAALADAPESEPGNEQRTQLTRDRHRSLSIGEILDELRRAERASSDALDAIPDDDVDTVELVWLGAPMRISTICISRAFEVWTHADDVRRALGRPPLTPPAPSLASMSSRAAEWAALMLLLAGHDLAPTPAVIELTGAGGSTLEVQLGLEPAPADAPRAFTIRADVVEFCRTLARRSPASGMDYSVTGDTTLARDLVHALPLLAQL